MARLRSNFQSGTITDNPLAIGATALNSQQFATLPTVVAPDYLVVILDPARINGAAEIVYVTAHAANSTTITALRGQENSTARQHLNGERWAAGETVGDFWGGGQTWYGTQVLDGPVFVQNDLNLMTLPQAVLLGSAARWQANTNSTISWPGWSTGPGVYTPTEGALRLTATAAGLMNAITSGSANPSDAFPVTPGQQYWARASARPVGAAAAQNVDVTIVWYQSGAQLSTSPGAAVAEVTGGAWVVPTVQATAPAGATHAAVVAEVQNSAAGAAHDFGGFGFGAGTLPTAWVAPIGVRVASTYKRDVDYVDNDLVTISTSGYGDQENAISRYSDTSWSKAFWTFRRARGTQPAPTAAVANDYVGGLRGAAYNAGWQGLGDVFYQVGTVGSPFVAGKFTIGMNNSTGGSGAVVIVDGGAGTVIVTTGLFGASGAGSLGTTHDSNRVDAQAQMYGRGFAWASDGAAHQGGVTSGLSISVNRSQPAVALYNVGAGGAVWLYSPAGTNNSDLTFARPGGATASNALWVFSQRSDNKTLLLFGYDGTTFKNVFQTEYANNTVQYTAQIYTNGQASIGINRNPATGAIPNSAQNAWQIVGGSDFHLESYTGAGASQVVTLAVAQTGYLTITTTTDATGVTVQSSQPSPAIAVSNTGTSGRKYGFISGSGGSGAGVGGFGFYDFTGGAYYMKFVTSNNGNFSWYGNDHFFGRGAFGAAFGRVHLGDLGTTDAYIVGERGDGAANALHIRGNNTSSSIYFENSNATNLVDISLSSGLMTCHYALYALQEFKAGLAQMNAGSFAASYAVWQYQGMATNNYAILQDSGANTYVNSGAVLFLRYQNADRLIMGSSTVEVKNVPLVMNDQTIYLNTNGDNNQRILPNWNGYMGGFEWCSGYGGWVIRAEFVGIELRVGGLTSDRNVRVTDTADTAFLDFYAIIHNQSDGKFKDFLDETDHMRFSAGATEDHKDIVRRVGRPRPFTWKDEVADANQRGRVRYGYDARVLPDEFTAPVLMGDGKSRPHSTVYTVDPQSMISVLYGAVNDILDDHDDLAARFEELDRKYTALERRLVALERGR